MEPATKEDTGRQEPVISYAEFPLKTFGNTPELQSAFSELQTKYLSLKKSLKKKKSPEAELSSPRLDFNLEPEAYYKAPELNRSISSKVEMQNEALEKGTPGWFRFSDIHEFILGGRGIIYQGAMHELQNVRNVVNPALTIRSKRLSLECHGRISHLELNLSPEHIRRMTTSQPPIRGEEGYKLLVNKNEQLFFYTESSEFRSPVDSVTPSFSLKYMPLRDFILPQQKGFYLSFKNIRLEDDSLAVYVSAALQPQQKPFYQQIVSDGISKNRFSQFALFVKSTAEEIGAGQ